MKRKKFLSRIAAAILAASVLFTGCQGTSQAESSSVTVSSTSQESAAQVPQKLEELRIGAVKEHMSFNMINNSTNVGGILAMVNYTGFVMAQLVQKDETGTVQPAFMRSWTISEDGKSLTFKIPTDAKFHDGVPVTAEDVEFTFNFYKEKMKKNNLSNMESIEILEPDTLRVTFSTPSAYSFLNDLNTMTTYVVPKHVWENIENPKEYEGEDSRIGCGPFKFVSYDEAAQTSYYEAVDDYSGGEVSIKKVSLHSYATHEALAMALINGEIDVVYNYAMSLDPSLAGLLEKSENIDLGLGANPGNEYVTFGLDRLPACRDLQFRKACSYAIDYSTMAKAIGGDYGEVAGRGVFAPGNRGFDASIEKLEFNVEMANSILDEAGYKDVDGDGFRENPDGSELDIMITPYATQATAPLRSRQIEIIADGFKQAGLKTHADEECLSNFDLGYQKVFNTHDYDLLIGGVTQGIASYNTASAYFAKTDNGMGYGTFDDPDYVDTYLSLFTLTTDTEYLESVAKLQKMNAELIPGIALCWQTSLFPYRTDTFSGGVYYPGWGMVNNKTWFTMTAKA